RRCLAARTLANFIWRGTPPRFAPFATLAAHLDPIKAKRVGVFFGTFGRAALDLTPIPPLSIGPAGLQKPLAVAGLPQHQRGAGAENQHHAPRFHMSRRCDLTGKGAQVGHKVSHSNIKTKRRFLPNLLNVTMISDALGRSVKLRVSANALKTVDHRGGLDAFLLKAKDDDLSAKALELKRQIRKKRAAAAG